MRNYRLMINKLRTQLHIVTLVFLLALSLTGCGKKIPPSQRETEVKLENQAELEQIQTLQYA